MAGVANVQGTLKLGNGAMFWAYVSPQEETDKYVTKWSVTVQQQDGDWAGTITSDNPEQQLQTPGLSGIFTVIVTASGPKFAEKKLTPDSESKADVGCNSNCAAMIGIVAVPGGADANYWTVYDALCSM
jgi:hypothetical protein